MSRLTRAITLPDDCAVTVKEMTVGEVRNWLLDAETGASEDPLHALALEDCSLSDLARMSDIDAQSLEGYTPSQLTPLIAAAKELNPHFFRVRAALSGVARMMLKEAEAMALSKAPAGL
jgi:hypothetical protein